MSNTCTTGVGTVLRSSAHRGSETPEVRTGYGVHVHHSLRWNDTAPWRSREAQLLQNAGPIFLLSELRSSAYTSPETISTRARRNPLREGAQTFKHHNKKAVTPSQDDLQLKFPAVALWRPSWVSLPMSASSGDVVFFKNSWLPTIPTT